MNASTVLCDVFKDLLVVIRDVQKVAGHCCCGRFAVGRNEPDGTSEAHSACELLHSKSHVHSIDPIVDVCALAVDLCDDLSGLFVLLDSL